MAILPFWINVTRTLPNNIVTCMFIHWNTVARNESTANFTNTTTNYQRFVFSKSEKGI